MEVLGVDVEDRALIVRGHDVEKFLQHDAPHLDGSGLVVEIERELRRHERRERQRRARVLGGGGLGGAERVVGVDEGEQSATFRLVPAQRGDLEHGRQRATIGQLRQIDAHPSGGLLLGVEVGRRAEARADRRSGDERPHLDEFAQPIEGCRRGEIDVEPRLVAGFDPLGGQDPRTLGPEERALGRILDRGADLERGAGSLESAIGRVVEAAFDLGRLDLVQHTSLDESGEDLGRIGGGGDLESSCSGHSTPPDDAASGDGA